MTDLGAVGRGLVDRLDREGGRFGLAEPLRATYVPNPGGFVNASFTVAGRDRSVHVKLSPEPGKFDLWFSLRERLARDYRAPEILGRIELEDVGFSGLVFPHLAGSAPGPSDEARRLPELVVLSARLAADRDLAARLPGFGVASHRSCYETGIFECLSEDLVAVKADPVVRAWLTAADLRFLAAEADALRTRGRAVLDDRPCDTAIHGDLWLQNVLVTDDDWYVLDWDHIDVGDPAADLTMLLHDPRVAGRDWRHLLPDDPALRTRIEFLTRATALDEVVDPLADVTEIPDGLADADAVRTEKRRLSLEALARYRRLYG